jgi:SGNH hydrolase-like domain, acetyltransferase AlgX
MHLFQIGVLLALLSVVHGQMTVCPAAIKTNSSNQEWSLDGVIPGKDGWLFLEWDLRTDLALPKEVRPWVKRLADAMKTRDITLIAVPIPPRGILHAEHLDTSNALASTFSATKATANYEQLLADLSASGLQVVNPIANMLSDSDHASFKTDLHWTVEGAKLVAEAVSTQLMSLPVYAALTKSTITLTPTGSSSNIGKYAEVVADLCNLDSTTLPSEPISLYELGQFSQ